MLWFIGQCVLVFLLSVGALGYEQLCSCQCSGEHSVLSLGAEACSSCTKKYCSEHAKTQCASVDDLDIIASCFQRESTKDKLIVYFFVSITIALLGYELIGKSLIQKHRSGR